MLNVEEQLMDEDGIERVEYHSHYPYGSSLDYGQEIRIAIQHQDLYTLPSQSYLDLQGRFLKDDGSAPPTAATTIITNNAFPFLFDEIRYEICATEIDRVRNPGITSSIKGYASFVKGSENLIENYGWVENFTVSTEGYFNVCIPLSTLLGFFESYQKVVINVKQELILLRSRRDENCYLSQPDRTGGEREKAKIELTSLTWRVPYLTLNDRHRLELHRLLEKGKVIRMDFRCLELYENPLLQTTQKHVWNVKTSSQIEKPRYVILAFQTARKNTEKKIASRFDHCNLSNVKLYLNSKCYPYDDLNLNFDRNQFARIYQMYATFQHSYYGAEFNHPLLSLSQFKEKGTLYILDCSKQSESLKSGPIDVMLEFEASTAFPAETSAYCLIIHDRSVEYNPLTNIVRRMV